MISFKFPATVSHFPARTGQVYLPPAWFANPHPHLPVIELLHGAPGSPVDWTRGGRADLTADAYAQTHHGFAPILVMPDVNGADWWHDSECVNGPQGNAETYLTVDVRNAVVRAFGARADGESWGVAGLSEGGSCALQMGLRHPDLFAVLGDFSGDDHPYVSGGPQRLFWGRTPRQLFQAEQSYDPRVILSRTHWSDPPAIVFSAGRGDEVLAKMLHLVAASTARPHPLDDRRVRWGTHLLALEQELRRSHAVDDATPRHRRHTPIAHRTPLTPSSPRGDLLVLGADAGGWIDACKSRSGSRHGASRELPESWEWHRDGRRCSGRIVADRVGRCGLDERSRGHAWSAPNVCPVAGLAIAPGDTSWCAAQVVFDGWTCRFMRLGCCDA